MFRPLTRPFSQRRETRNTGLKRPKLAHTFFAWFVTPVWVDGAKLQTKIPYSKTQKNHPGLLLKTEWFLLKNYSLSLNLSDLVRNPSRNGNIVGENNLVEVTGVEPVSEKAKNESTTSVVSNLV